jgi:hypothetical protein
MLFSKYKLIEEEIKSFKNTKNYYEEITSNFQEELKKKILLY